MFEGALGQLQGSLGLAALPEAEEDLHGLDAARAALLARLADVQGAVGVAVIAGPRGSAASQAGRVRRGPAALASLRLVVLTSQRRAALDAVMDAALLQAEQRGGGAESGGDTVPRIPAAVMAALAKPADAARFDALFALTFALDCRDN